MSECVVRMEMPAEHCIDCRYMVSRDNDDCILQSDEANERAESWEDLKAGCPIICQLPEGHGRLVDKDEMLKKIENYHRYMTVGRESDPRCIIEDSPTIVPAERSDNGETC